MKERDVAIELLRIMGWGKGWCCFDVSVGDELLADVSIELIIEVERRVDVRVRRHGNNWSHVRCRTGTGSLCLRQNGRGMAMWAECSGYKVVLVRIVHAWSHACVVWPSNVPGELRRWGVLSSRCNTWGPGIRFRGGLRRSWSEQG